jgi:hypothetical protein
VTEKDWFGCEEPQAMLKFLYGPATERKLRLFAAACCRRIWDLLAEEWSRRAVETAERYADGLVDAAALRIAAAGAEAVAEDLAARAATAEQVAEATAAFAALNVTRPDDSAASYVAANAASAAYHAGALRAGLRSDTAPPREGAVAAAARAAECAAQARLLREVVGNPFRAAAVDPGWLARDWGTLPRLARAAEEDRRLPEGWLDPARLAVLADALEDAGCTDRELLGHLRGPGPHVRGCWAVDLLSRKE